MYKEFKRILINNKTRILYKLPKSNKLYIKNKGKMILYSDFKKNNKPKKMKGGIYNESDLNRTITRNGIEVIADEQSLEPIEDPINLQPIPKNRAILVNGVIYNVSTINEWVSRGNTTNIQRVPITPSKINEIKNKFIESQSENKSEILDKSIANKMKKLVIKLYDLNMQITNLPQSGNGLRHLIDLSRQVNETNGEINLLINNNNWLKSSKVMKEIFKSDQEIRDGLATWINSLDT